MGDLVIKDLNNNKQLMEDTYNKINEYKQEKEKSQLYQKEELRAKTQKKIYEIKEALNKNIQHQELINLILKETGFKYDKLRKLLNKLTLIFMCIYIITIGVVSYLFINKLVYLVIILSSSIIVITLLSVIIKMIVRVKFYKANIKKCKNMKLDLENIVELVEEILDNYIKLSEQLSTEFLKSIKKQQSKTDYDRYIALVGDNNKNLRKKIKNKKLHIYKGSFCKSKDMLIGIETIENNYFNTIFPFNRRNTLEEAIKSYLEEIN